MKLTVKERQAVELLRELDAQQREIALARLRAEVISNQITKKAGGIKKVVTVGNHKIVRAFGKAPPWRRK